MIYSAANDKISEEVKHIVLKVAEFTTYETNILKATTAEKRKLLGFIAYHISKSNRIIQRALLQIYSMIKYGIKEYHIRDFIKTINNRVNVNNIIEKWNQK